MKRTLTALTVAATMFATSASAFDPDDLQRLEDTGDCVSCDLSDADLSGADLSRAMLSYAKLSYADLGAANLRDADLRLTYMNGATLCNTTMPDGSVIYSGC